MFSLTSKQYIFRAILFTLALSSINGAKSAEQKKLPDIPPPTQSTPETWLARARNCHAEANEKYRAYTNKTTTSEIYEQYNQRDMSVQAETVTKLKTFGTTATEVCLKESTLPDGLTGVTNLVLINIGAAAVEPMIRTIPDSSPSTVEQNLFGVLARMNISPTNELCRLACSPGPLRFTAIRLLARLKTDPALAADESAAYNQLGATEEKYRDLLLTHINNEPNSSVKSDFIICQKYFSPPTEHSISAIAAVLNAPVSASTRTAAVQALAFMLSSANTTQQNTIAIALAKLLLAPNQQSVKIAAIEALRNINGRVDNCVIKALQMCAAGNSYAARQASLQTLTHLAIHNEACIKNIKEALNEQDLVTVDYAQNALLELSPSARQAIEANRVKQW